MKRKACALLIPLLFFLCFSGSLQGQEPGKMPKSPYSEETKECIECHSSVTPGIYADWLKSRHGITSPEGAVLKPELERRISSTDIPERLRSVAVGCFECHSLNPEAHKDNFDHFGQKINVIVSPSDCKTCHAIEAEQYSHSKKAYALEILTKNPVYQILIEAITGRTMVDGMTAASVKAENLTVRGTCYACHGTEITFKGMKTIESDFGEVSVPVLDAWPNQGVGRINPDGSRGACTSCHPRHGFSIEVARKPYTCAQCHVEPDVPAYNVYKESKHGNIFESKKKDWNWSTVPWKVGEDFKSPTCASCHNSLLVTAEGEVIAQRTHDFGSRLWIRLLGVIYSHPQPKSGKTFEIKNKDGLPLPTAFTGELASDYLIDGAEQIRRKAEMGKICRACHSSSWTENHFAAINRASQEADEAILSTTQLLVGAWNGGIADRSNPFDEALEKMWIEQWLFYANSVRYAYAMGGPDFATFKNGWWNLTHTHQRMKMLVELKKRQKK